MRSHSLTGSYDKCCKCALNMYSMYSITIASPECTNHSCLPYYCCSLWYLQWQARVRRLQKWLVIDYVVVFLTSPFRCKLFVAVFVCVWAERRPGPPPVNDRSPSREPRGSDGRQASKRAQTTLWSVITAQAVAAAQIRSGNIEATLTTSRETGACLQHLTTITLGNTACRNPKSLKHVTPYLQISPRTHCASVTVCSSHWYPVLLTVRRPRTIQHKQKHLKLLSNQLPLPDATPSVQNHIYLQRKNSACFQLSAIWHSATSITISAIFVVPHQVTGKKLALRERFSLVEHKSYASVYFLDALAVTFN